MAKIKFNNWIFPITEFRELASGYLITGLIFRQSSSTHGKSKGVVKCPCCGCNTDIYLWSFAGGGKRCNSCNVLLGSQGAFLSKKRNHKRNKNRIFNNIKNLDGNQDVASRLLFLHKKKEVTTYEKIKMRLHSKDTRKSWDALGLCAKL